MRERSTWSGVSAKTDRTYARLPIQEEHGAFRSAASDRKRHVRRDGG
jgi:hypothetical protein